MKPIGKARPSVVIGICGTLFVSGVFFLGAAPLVVPTAALALSDLKGTEAPKDEAAPETNSSPSLPGGDLLTPGPLIDGGGANAASPAADEAPVDVLRDISAAPEPVRRMRQQLIDAASTGEIERLRPLMGTGDSQTQLMITDEPDPIAMLKSLSGDEEGAEILAIMIDVLSTGFVHVEKGTPDEAYVWPYFAEKSISSLTAPEKVDLMRIVTAGDYQGMLEYGNYSFFRIGISPDGKWKFFTAGD